jgi:ketosteroid isomerase-like protein
MPSFAKLATAVTALIVVSTAALAQQPGPAESARTALTGAAAEAGAVVDAFHAALKAGDTAKAAALLDDAVLIHEAGGAERSKAEYGAHHLPADAAFAKTSDATLTRRVGHVSGDLAWIASEGDVRSSAGSAGPTVRKTTETMILRRTPQGWRIVHVHWSSRAAAAAGVSAAGRR